MTESVYRPMMGGERKAGRQQVKDSTFVGSKRVVVILDPPSTSIVPHRLPTFSIGMVSQEFYKGWWIGR